MQLIIDRAMEEYKVYKSNYLGASEAMRPVQMSRPGPYDIWDHIAARLRLG